ncbi:MAG: 50S ribosomal protein L32 [Candidatus Omnitrophica bacterium]|nr:50S ribosomal protein L32 [Candidatus Omnitrophota bacterium]
MAHPKRRHSHSRTRKKRTHQKLSIPTLVPCKECGRLKPAHMVCPFCGYYRGKEIVVIEKEKK